MAPAERAVAPSELEGRILRRAHLINDDPTVTLLLFDASKALAAASAEIIRLRAENEELRNERGEARADVHIIWEALGAVPHIRGALELRFPGTARRALKSKGAPN